jgi:hypothetical protein
MCGENVHQCNSIDNMIEQPSRVIQGTLATPLYEFVHETTDSTIALVGTIHLGTPGYFANIQRYVEAREIAGSDTHFEGVRRVDDAILRASMPELADDVIAMRQAMGFIEPMAKDLGLIHQRAGIQHKENWENHDVNELELARMLGPEAIRKIVKSDRDLEDSSIDTDLRRKISLFSFRMLPAISTLQTVLPINRYRRNVVQHRNSVALSAVADAIAEDPDRHITMIWGANHVPGIRKGLEMLGYRSSPAYWVGAFSVKQHAGYMDS